MGSVGVTPTSIVAIAGVTMNAPARPSARPAPLRRRPCPMTSRRICAGEAPTAMRTLISVTRWLTVWILVGERPQEDTVGDAEERGTRTDPDGECDRDDRREQRAAAQGAHGIEDVTSQQSRPRAAQVIMAPPILCSRPLPRLIPLLRPTASARASRTTSGCG